MQSSFLVLNLIIIQWGDSEYFLEKQHSLLDLSNLTILFICGVRQLQLLCLGFNRLLYSALNKLKIKTLLGYSVNNFWMNVNWRLEANTIKKYYIISVIFEIAYYTQKNPSLCFHEKKKKPEFKVKNIFSIQYVQDTF